MLLLIINQVNALKRTHMHARDYKSATHMVQMKHISNIYTFPCSRMWQNVEAFAGSVLYNRKVHSFIFRQESFHCAVRDMAQKDTRHFESLLNLNG